MMVFNYKSLNFNWRGILYSIFSFSIILFFTTLSTTVDASIYAPGQTLEPDCAPGSVDCGVDPALGLTLSSINSLLNSSTSTNVGIGTINPIAKLDVVGSINLPRTASSTFGVISKDGNSFLHDYSGGVSSRVNIFLGINSGNFTLSTREGNNYCDVDCSGAPGPTNQYQNIGIGNESLQSISSGLLNVAVGQGTLSFATSSSGNTALGSLALHFSTGVPDQGNNSNSNTNNTAVGGISSYSNTSGSVNTSVGYGSLFRNKTGSGNVGLGYFAGWGNIEGNNNTFIGHGADLTWPNTAFNNATAIGYNAKVGASNTLILGGTGSTAVKVGIGTATPESTLTVVGTGIATTTAEFRPISGQTANVLNIYNNTGSVATVFGPTGKVGIGNISPDTLLTVGAQPTGGQDTGMVAAFNLASDSEGVVVRRGGVSNPQELVFGANQSLLYSTINSFHGGVDWGAIVLNSGNGNVGIGAVGGATPAAKLHVVDNSFNPSGTVFLAQNTTGNKNALNVRVFDNLTDLGADYRGNNNNTNLAFSTRVSGGALSEKMRIGYNGNVGIGTTTPGVKLDILDDSTDAGLRIRHSNMTAGISIGYDTIKSNGTSANQNINITAAGTGSVNLTSTVIKFSNGSTYSYGNSLNAGYHSDSNSLLYINYVGYQNGSTQFRDTQISNGKQGNVAFFQGSTGNVGIGTTTPSQKLVVAGNIAPDVTNLYSLGSSNMLGYSSVYSSNIYSLNNAGGNSTDLNLYGYGSYGGVRANVGCASSYCDFSVIAGGSGIKRFSVDGTGVVKINTGSAGVTSGGLIFTPADGGATASIATKIPSGTSHGTNLQLIASDGGSVANYNGGNLVLTPGIKGGSGIDGVSYFSRGNVGIGTSSPLYKLEVTDSTTYTGLRLDASKADNTGQAAFVFSKKGVNKWQFGMDFAANGTSDWYVYDQVNAKAKIYANTAGTLNLGANAFSSPALTILDGGNIGIGTTNPSKKLSVVGSASITGATSIGGPLALNFTSTSGLFDIGASSGSTQSNLVPVMTSNTSPSGIASDSLSRSNAYGYFNGEEGYVDYVVQNGSYLLDYWLKYEFPSNEIVSGYKIHGRPGFPTRTPRTWTFQGWNGGSWVTLDSRSGVTDWSNIAQTFNFSNSTGYISYRLYITETNDNTGGINLTELELLTSATYDMHALFVANSGNVGIGTTTPNHLITLSGGAYSDGATWTNASSKFLKENFIDLNKEEILNKISQLSIQQWNYKIGDINKKHIGPVAEQFYELFGLNGTDKAISTIDPAGIALVGVQAITEKVGWIGDYISKTAEGITGIFKRVQTEELCVDENTCLDKASLRKLIEDYKTSNVNTDNQSETTVIENIVATSTDEVEQISATPVTTTITETVVTPEPAPEPTPETSDSITTEVSPVI